MKTELLAEWNLKELKALAGEMNIPNRSKMNKEELAVAIEDSFNRL